MEPPTSSEKQPDWWVRNRKVLLPIILLAAYIPVWIYMSIVLGPPQQYLVEYLAYPTIIFVGSICIGLFWSKKSE